MRQGKGRQVDLQIKQTYCTKKQSTPDFQPCTAVHKLPLTNQQPIPCILETPPPYPTGMRPHNHHDRPPPFHHTRNLYLPIFTYNVWSYLLTVPCIMYLFSFIFLTRMLKQLKIHFLTSFFIEHIHALQVRGGGVSGGSPQTAKDAVARVRGGRTSDTGTSTCTPALAIQQQQRS